MSWKQATFNPHRSGAKSTDWRLHVIFSACRVVNTIGVCVNDKCTVQERQRRVELLGMNQAILYITWHVWTCIQKQVIHAHLVEHSRSIKFAKVRNFGFCPKVHFFVIRILFIAFYFSSSTSDFDYSNFIIIIIITGGIPVCMVVRTQGKLDEKNFLFKLKRWNKLKQNNTLFSEYCTHQNYAV